MPKKRRKPKPHSHHYKSEAVSDRNRLFHRIEAKRAPVVIQDVKVDVKVEKDDDCLTSCFSGLAKCFGKG